MTTILLNLGLIVAGVALLTYAADYLVDFGAALAEKMRVTPAVIGLTIVAAGTSMPEFFVSTVATYHGQVDIAIGNVVGSNIFNVAFILGVCAVVARIPISPQLFRLDYPIMVIVSGLLLLLCRDGWLDRLESGFLLGCVVLFWAYSVHLARKEVAAHDKETLGELVPPIAEKLKGKSGLYLAGGTALTIVGLGIGARLLVTGAADLAAAVGISERVIGLTIVAGGTSMPELVASLAAAFKKHHEMAVTNIIGSNIFNILGILGASGLIAPLGINQQYITLDNWVMCAVAVGLFPFMFTGYRLSRSEGVVMLAGYCVYAAYLILNP